MEDQLTRTQEGVQAINTLPTPNGNHHRKSVSYKIKERSTCEGGISMTIDDESVMVEFGAKRLKRTPNNIADQYVRIVRSPDFQDDLVDELNQLRGAYRRILLSRSKNHNNAIMQVKCKNVNNKAFELELLVTAFRNILVKYEMFEIASAITKKKPEVSAELHIQTKAYNEDMYLNGVNDNGTPNIELFETYDAFVKYGTSNTHHIGNKTAREINNLIQNGGVVMALSTEAIQSNGGAVRKAYPIKAIIFKSYAPNPGFGRYQLVLGDETNYKIGEATQITGQFPTKFVVV